tara:strand:- start:5495 stop:5779 length:285 start_codon:yes stop_codon:yes gene_type:complete
MNRKQRRAIKKHVGAEAQEKMADHVAQFGKLPESCSACNKEFDKKDKDMVQSWNVLVKQEIVRLFCPECIEKTREVLNERSETIENVTPENIKW